MNFTSIEFAGETFALYEARVAMRLSNRTLFVADPHFGKASLFRQRGLPMPSGSTAADLARLDSILQTLRPARLVFLGDLLHGPESNDDETLSPLAEFRARHDAIEMIVVEGNHDRAAGRWQAEIGMKLVRPGTIDAGIELRHEPADEPKSPAIAGHLHPGVRLDDFDGSGVTVPCFVCDEKQLILPAFGRLTGAMRMEFVARRRLFACAAGRVIEANLRPTSRRRRGV